MSLLFISAMALQQDTRDLQETQFREIFLNLSKGKEELKTLLVGDLVKKSPEDNKDERLEHLQAEVDAIRTQMMGADDPYPRLRPGIIRVENHYQPAPSRQTQQYEANSRDRGPSH